MAKVCLIIPVYNVEKYLTECLNSVEKQTYKDFECVLVDDGSTDSSGKMCDEYAASHPNTRVIHKENGGLSDARNVGVKESESEYVVFIDSDDYVTEDYIEYLVNLAQKHNADVAISARKKFVDGTAPVPTVSEPFDTSVTPEKALDNICYGKYAICAWGKLYKRNLVEKYPYPKGKLYEDVATTYKIVGDKSNTNIAYGNKQTYFWRQRAGSITKATISDGHLHGLVASKEMLNFMEENYPSVIPAAQVRYANKIIDTAYRAVVSNKDKLLFQKIRIEIIPIYRDIIKNKKSSVTVKLRATALKMGYIPFWIVSKMYSVIKKEA